ncbi:MAG: DNA alkylation repair protein, partial [Syntrophaceae bacterium]|nr:DNA alkylation repair protein [Syntrophaceae bacterium]
EEIKNYGVVAGAVRTIARKYFKEIKNLPKQEIFSLCEELLGSGFSEEATIAFQWVYSIKKQYQKEDFVLFEKWIKNYITNWAKCDDFCTHCFGHFILEFPEFIPKVKLWTKSTNRWLRRASAVIFIYPIKQKRYNDDVFEIADLLLLDEDDMVQKGYGWLLKETSKLYPKKVFEYVLEHKNYMPRVALRYAIEKLPKEMKLKAMAK